MPQPEFWSQPHPRRRRWTPRTGGSLQIYLKDLPLALEAGRELAGPLATGLAAFQPVQLARALGRADRDEAALITALMSPRRAERRPVYFLMIAASPAPVN